MTTRRLVSTVAVSLGLAVGVPALVAAPASAAGHVAASTVDPECVIPAEPPYLAGEFATIEEAIKVAQTGRENIAAVLKKCGAAPEFAENFHVLIAEPDGGSSATRKQVWMVDLRAVDDTVDVNRTVAFSAAVEVDALLRSHGGAGVLTMCLDIPGGCRLHYFLIRPSDRQLLQQSLREWFTENPPVPLGDGPVGSQAGGGSGLGLYRNGRRYDVLWWSDLGKTDGHVDVEYRPDGTLPDHPDGPDHHTDPELDPGSV